MAAGCEEWGHARLILQQPPFCCAPSVTALNAADEHSLLSSLLIHKLAHF